MVDTGAKLWLMRVDLITQFKNNIESMIKRYDSSIQFEIGYFVEAPREETYRKQVRVALNTDLSLGRTTVGPIEMTFDFFGIKKTFETLAHKGNTSLLWYC